MRLFQIEARITLSSFNSAPRAESRWVCQIVHFLKTPKIHFTGIKERKLL